MRIFFKGGVSIDIILQIWQTKWTLDVEQYIFVKSL